MAVGGLVAWRTKNLIASLAAGMVTIWIIILVT